MSSPTHVVVAGGGVAALETALALRALAGDRVSVTIVAPNTFFAYRPIASHDPLGICRHVRVPLAYVARAAGADLRHDRLTEVEPAARRIHTAAGYELCYDALVLAVGAQPLAAPTGTVAFDPRRIAECRSVLQATERGGVGSLAFVEPAGPSQGLELYDLVLETAVAARQDGASPALTLVTAQPAPLAVAGEHAAEILSCTLSSHGVRLVGPAHLRAFAHGKLDLAPEAWKVSAERVIAAPRLGGPRPVHLPCDGDGFLPTDPYGQVAGVEAVFAAGDCTVFPVKHPSLAAQQADAVAATLAGKPDPFKPVLRCMLPARLRWYLEAPLTGGQGDATQITPYPLWPGATRFGARYLTAWLAGVQNHQAADRGDHGRVPGRRRPATVACH
jgi:sulfide:quinone oxidoreductase